MQSRGGLLSEADLEEFQPFWEVPTSIDYRGYTVHTAPPPCSGIQYLQSLKLVERFDLAGMGHNSAEAIHIMLEAMKIATADRIHYAPMGADCPTDELLSRELHRRSAAR